MTVSTCVCSKQPGPLASHAAGLRARLWSQAINGDVANFEMFILTTQPARSSIVRLQTRLQDDTANLVEVNKLPHARDLSSITSGYSLLDFPIHSRAEDWKRSLLLPIKSRSHHRSQREVVSRLWDCTRTSRPPTAHATGSSLHGAERSAFRCLKFVTALVRILNPPSSFMEKGGSAAAGAKGPFLLKRREPLTFRGPRT